MGQHHHPKLKPPADGEGFKFPYAEPYPGQLSLMRKLFEVIEEGKIGIFESPTGTGKSLSLLCGGLAWLRQNDKRHELEVEPEASHDDGPPGVPPWIHRHQAKLRRQQAAREVEQRDECIKRIRAKESLELAKLRAEGGVRKRVRHAELETSEDEFVVDAYGEEENVNGQVKLLLAQLKAMDREDELAASAKESAFDEEPDLPKVYYASRTHSQLAQLIQEFTRIPPEARMGCVTLGSRANLCLNQALVHACKGDNELLNERCGELQKPGTKAEKRCPYYLPSERPLQAAFRDQALLGAADVEDLVKLGRRVGTCAYYGARKAVRPARLVAVPYNLLLQKSARSASGICLKGHAVIIDEAHNLIESLEASHSPRLTLGQLQATHHQLGLYLTKYRTRLLGQNTVFLSQTLTFLKQLIAFLATDHTSQSVNSSQLVHALGLDMLNLLRLATYLRESRVAHKLHGFVKREEKDEHARVHIYALESFLVAMARPDADGSFLLERGEIMRYVLLNPAEPFRELLQEARAVVLVGGTLAPLQSFVDQLCPGFADRVVTFSCGHVVPASSLRCFTLSRGLRDPNRELVFSFATRGDPSLLDEVAAVLGNLMFTIPDGMVCFFPSHAALDAFHAHIAANGQLEFIGARKRVFREPRGHAATDAVLQSYQSWIDRREALGTELGGKGAILLCVVGGRLSEGINFSDAYGRGVVVVGLPFPNLASPDLKLKLQRLDGGAPSTPCSPSQIYYANLCMRAVNQSVGRAIRHARDYAVIVLLDARYGQARNPYAAMLPGWIKPSIVHCTDFGPLASQIPKFFKLMEGKSHQ
ncbi:ATP-dependent DNA helicase chl1 [Massospora cicadina]|nr:ATP-dependent DNA helicase chl1 [Massospora cicadina]